MKLVLFVHHSRLISEGFGQLGEAFRLEASI